jgi:hypothetical protein
MIIWINGAFAAGKTTLARELERRLPDAMPFDPEYVGYILTKWVPPAGSGDFQDIPLWRKQDAEAREFGHRNVEAGVQARAGLPADTLVLRGDQHTPAELADLVLTSAAAEGPAQ